MSETEANPENEKIYISSSTDYIPMGLVVSQTHIKITHFQAFLKMSCNKNDWVGFNSIVRLGICFSFAEEGECAALSSNINLHQNKSI